MINNNVGSERALDLLWQAELAGSRAAMEAWLDRHAKRHDSYLITDDHFVTVDGALADAFMAEFATSCRYGDVMLMPTSDILRLGLLP